MEKLKNKIVSIPAKFNSESLVRLECHQFGLVFVSDVFELETTSFLLASDLSDFDEAADESFLLASSIFLCSRSISACNSS